MATVEKEVLDTVKKRKTADDTINRFVMEQEEEQFPKASDIEVEFKYSDPFAFPKWLDFENYSYAWLDPTDDIQMHRALETDYFRLVTRMSSCIKGKSYDRDFRSHGAVERQRMVLAFRPRDLDAKLRTMPVIQHKAMVEAMASGKEEEGYSTSFQKYIGDADKGGKMTVMAEEAIHGSGLVDGSGSAIIKGA
jgi:hypothetical protein